MIKTKNRLKLENEDKLGVLETYEARIRGALSVYSNTIEMLNEYKQTDNKDILNYILSDIDNSKKQLNKILYLLENSELNRIELEEQITKRVKLNNIYRTEGKIICGKN